MSIIFAILLFSFLIFIHEFGHFAAAKLSGVQVNEFSIFMGPALVSWTRGETKYAIRCIPIGGYCAMEGENGDSENPRAFHRAAWWKRLIILVSGSFMNFLTGLVIIAVVLSCTATYVSPRISSIEPDSYLMEEGGLLPGDKILEIDGKSITIYEDFQLAVMSLPDGEYDVTVSRDGKTVTLQDVPMIRKEFEYINDLTGKTETYYGYGFSFTEEETTASSVTSQILPTARFHVEMVVTSLKMLLTGEAGLKDMGGPIQIVGLMSSTAEGSSSTSEALLGMLTFGGFIAINLAVMNMLPIPALDGGRSLGLIITTIIEKVFKKKVDPKYEGYIHSAFMVLLLLFMAFIMLKDIITIF